MKRPHNISYDNRYSNFLLPKRLRRLKLLQKRPAEKGPLGSSLSFINPFERFALFLPSRNTFKVFPRTVTALTFLPLSSASLEAKHAGYLVARVGSFALARAHAHSLQSCLHHGSKMVDHARPGRARTWGLVWRHLEHAIKNSSHIHCYSNLKNFQSSWGLKVWVGNRLCTFLFLSSTRRYDGP